MRVQTVRDLGALVRTARRARGLTQADLADRLQVSRDWVVRLEKGSPRLEVQRVLDALVVLGLTLDVVDDARPIRPTTTKKSAAKTGKHTLGAAKDADPFAFLGDRTS
jgi:y4mF family transcriptional regulator